jgi:hypothetical protein
MSLAPTGTDHRIRKAFTRLAVIAAFTGLPKLRNLHRGQPTSDGPELSCPSRLNRGQTATVAPRSPLAQRDVKRMIRSERALTRVPLDVEIARSLAVDRFPAPNSWLR